jgi:hypothetical protein
LDNHGTPVTACIIMAQHLDLQSALYMASQFNPDAIVIISDELVICSKSEGFDIRVCPSNTKVESYWRIVPRFPDNQMYRSGITAGMDINYVPTLREQNSADAVYQSFIRRMQQSPT